MVVKQWPVDYAYCDVAKRIYGMFEQYLHDNIKKGSLLTRRCPR
jgi:hypothetical protein